MNNEFSQPCHFCDTGKITTRFIPEASGACYKCIESIPSSVHIEDRYKFLKENKDE